MTKLRVLLALGGFLAALAAGAAPVDSRFSASLNPVQRKACGLDRLVPDQVGSLDALVRRDAAVVASLAPNAFHLFSRSLQADEARAAGLDRLTPLEVGNLDALESRWVRRDPVLADAGYAFPLPAAADTAAGDTRVATDKPQLHGSVSLEFGAGSGGYSERSEATDVYYCDPAHGLTLDFGYADTTVKSKYPIVGGPVGYVPGIWPGEP